MATCLKQLREVLVTDSAALFPETREGVKTHDISTASPRTAEGLPLGITEAQRAPSHLISA